MNEAIAQREIRARFRSKLVEYLNVELATVATELGLIAMPSDVDDFYSLTDADLVGDIIERSPGMVPCVIVTPPLYTYVTPGYTGSPSEYAKQREQSVTVTIGHRATHLDFLSGYTQADLDESAEALDISEAYLGAIINAVRKHVPCGTSGVRVELSSASIVNEPMLERVGTKNTITTIWNVSSEVVIKDKVREA